MARVTKKQLESDLQDLSTFSKPNLDLEQYQTPPNLAADVLNIINLSEKRGAINGKVILDLGCGCGILGFGCIRLNAKFVLGVDIDASAIAVAIDNREEIGLDPEVIAFIERDVSKLSRDDLPPNTEFDMIIMNPPFGTKSKEKADTMFVEKGLELVNVVYSMHKSSTRSYWKGTIPKMWKEKHSWNVNVEVLLEGLWFKIPNIHNFHRHKEQYILIDLIKFTR